MNSLRIETRKYIPEKHMFDTIEFFKENKINVLHFYSVKTLKLKFNNKILNGGNNDDSKIIKINLRNDKYKARIYEYDDDNLKIINFIKIHSIINDNNEFDENNHCGILIIDNDRKEATIQSINNYTDCIKCINSHEKFKIGEVLIQIMIGICVNRDIKKLGLTDNSYLECGNEKIPLIYLRTITKGIPYYSKFGFYPINHNKFDKNGKNELKIYNNNKITFDNNPTISRDRFIKILFYKKFDKNDDKIMLNYINNKLIPLLKDDNIVVSKFINKIVNDHKNEESCDILHNILFKVYEKCGYEKYKYKYFEMNIDKKLKDIINTHIQLTNL